MRIILFDFFFIVSSIFLNIALEITDYWSGFAFHYTDPYIALFMYRHMHQCIDNPVDSGFRNKFIFMACKEISFYGESTHVFYRWSRFRDIEASYVVMVSEIIYECLFVLRV